MTGEIPSCELGTRITHGHMDSHGFSHSYQEAKEVVGTKSLAHPFPILCSLIRSRPDAQLLCQSFQLDSNSIFLRVSPME